MFDKFNDYFQEKARINGMLESYHMQQLVNTFITVLIGITWTVDKLFYVFFYLFYFFILYFNLALHGSLTKFSVWLTPKIVVGSIVFKVDNV